MKQWISINERLPEEHERVLVSGDDGVFSAYLYLNAWSCDPKGSYACDGCVFGITHCRPLPKRPSNYPGPIALNATVKEMK